MMRIDIVVTVLTVRIPLFRPALSQLVNPDHDAWCRREKMKRRSDSLLSRRSEGMKGHSLRKPFKGSEGCRNYIFM